MVKCKKGQRHKWRKWERVNRDIAMPIRKRQCKICHRWQVQELQKDGSWL